MNKIDIVIPWVNGNDPKWRELRELYLDSRYPDVSIAGYRFRDWGFLKYIFRGIEQFMPWVNRVFLITYGPVPSYINCQCKKLEIVTHANYIPEIYLPTFNSTAIQMNLHRISKLSENFILFNDDMFPISEIDSDYFFKDNLVCDQAIQTIIVPNPSSVPLYQCRSMNNVRIINKHFSKREVIGNNHDKWFNKCYNVEDLERNSALEYWSYFTGFRVYHMPASYKKSVFKKIWDLEYETLNIACQNKFRYYTDVTEYLVRYWQLCEGLFYPRKAEGKRFLLAKDRCEDAAKCIMEQSALMVSLEDEYVGDNEFNNAVKTLETAFDTILPQKSSFEI